MSSRAGRDFHRLCENEWILNQKKLWRGPRGAFFHCPTRQKSLHLCSGRVFWGAWDITKAKITPKNAPHAARRPSAWRSQRPKRQPRNNGWFPSHLTGNALLSREIPGLSWQRTRLHRIRPPAGIRDVPGNPVFLKKARTQASLCGAFRASLCD